MAITTRIIAQQVTALDGANSRVSKYPKFTVQLGYSVSSMAATELLDAASRAEGSALAAKDAETTIKNILGPNGDNPQGSLKFVNKDNSGATTKHLEGVTGDNDGWYIGSGSDGTNKGFLEIGVIDDGDEEIRVVQRGPANSIRRILKLLDTAGHTRIPGNLYMEGAATVVRNKAYFGAGGADIYMRNTAGGNDNQLTITDARELLFKGKQVFYDTQNLSALANLVRAGVSTGNASSWLKLATVTNPGSSAAKAEFMISGVDQFGATHGGTDFVSISGRGMPSTINSDNIDLVLKVRRLSGMSPTEGMRYGIVQISATKYDFYVQMTNYISNPAIACLQYSGSVVLYPTPEITTEAPGFIRGNVYSIYDSQNGLGVASRTTGEQTIDSPTLSVRGITKGYQVAAQGMVDWTPPSQGAYMNWNWRSGSGFTNFFNHRGGGPGGFDWYNGTGSTWTRLMSISSVGKLEVAGEIESAGDIWCGRPGAAFHANDSTDASNAHIWFKGNNKERAVIYAPPSTDNLGTLKVRAKNKTGVSAGDFEFRSDGIFSSKKISITDAAYANIGSLWYPIIPSNYDLNNLIFSSGEEGSEKGFDCPAEASGAGVLNKPNGVKGNFRVRVDRVRRNTDTDTIHRQVLIAGDTKASYERWHYNSGGTMVWSEWTRQLVESGDITTFSDDAMIYLGKDKDLGMMKKRGSNGKMVYAHGKKFTVAKMSTDTSLTVSGAVVDVMTIDSTGAATLTGSWTATDFVKSSDARLKTNLKEIENPLEKVAQLTGYTYDKELPLGGASIEAGLIAQDIQKVLPEAVREGEDGMLGVSYDGVVALLINSVKELTERVAYLESQLKG